VIAVLVVGVSALVAWTAFRGGDGDPTATATTGGAGTTAPSTTPASTDSVPAPTVDAPPPCRYALLPARNARYGEWQRTLLDTTFALPQDYAPSDLVSVTEAGSASPEMVRSFVIPDLKALLQASERAENPVDVLIAYRSYARQQALFRAHVRSEGRTEALATTARPGHSEHQLGTTVDFRTKGQLDVPKAWESEPAGAWMAANAWRFGFIEEYPAGKEAVTCYSYEPWHYRYFGRAVARRIHDSRLTAREFLWQLDSKSRSTSAGASP
jgi:D-alanyl-D-alanine carboxypeptidase